MNYFLCPINHIIIQFCIHLCDESIHLDHPQSLASISRFLLHEAKSLSPDPAPLCEHYKPNAKLPVNVNGRLNLSEKYSTIELWIQLSGGPNALSESLLSYHLE